MTKKLPYQRGSLLFHSSHGACNVRDIIKETQAGKEQYYYALEPNRTRLKGTRFLVDANQVEASGFHPVISSREAKKILDYLRTSDPNDRKLGPLQASKVLSLIGENAPWSFSRVILIFCREKDGKGAKGKREMLSRAARGLINELSYALEIPEEEALLKMKKSLKSNAQVNSWVLDTISNIFN